MSTEASSSRSLKWGVVLSYLSMGISILVSLFYTPIVIKNLGQQQYGLYNIASSVVGYLSLLNFGLGSAVVRFVTKYRVEKKDKTVEALYGLFLVVFALLAAIVVAAGLFIIRFEDSIFTVTTGAEGYRQLRIITLVMVINLAVSFPACVFSSVITSYERFAFLKGITIIKSLLTPVIMIPLLLSGHKAVTLALVIQILDISVSISYVVYSFARLRLHLSFKFNEIEKSVIREIVTFTSFIFLGLIVDQLYWSTDKVILSVLIGEIPVAVYAVASQIHSYYQQFSGSISDVFFPKVTKMVTQSSMEELSALFIKVGRIQALLLFLILSGFIIFGQEFIRLWAGTGYQDAYWIAILVLSPATIPLIESTGFLIIKAMNKHRFRAILYLVLALTNVVLSIPAAKKWSGIGCAACTCLVVVIGHGFIMNWFYYEKIGLPIPEYWKEIIKLLLPVVILCIVGILCNHFLWTDNPIAWAVKILTYSTLYIIIQWKFSFNEYEKGLFRGLLRKKSIID